MSPPWSPWEEGVTEVTGDTLRCSLWYREKENPTKHVARVLKTAWCLQGRTGAGAVGVRKELHKQRLTLTGWFTRLWGKRRTGPLWVQGTQRSKQYNHTPVLDTSNGPVVNT